MIRFLNQHRLNICYILNIRELSSGAVNDVIAKVTGQFGEYKLIKVTQYHISRGRQATPLCCEVK